MIQNQFVFISTNTQRLYCFEREAFFKSYLISTAKNGVGEQKNSECTPRGWHRIFGRIGLGASLNTVFVARLWTGEVYSKALAQQYPERDWILTRIVQLDGLEKGRNKGAEVDTLQRCIYIHGTPDTTVLGQPGSRGCIRMRNEDIIDFTEWVSINTRVYIE